MSGYVHAYVGEPDLDRIVSFQKFLPPFTLSARTRTLGVAVDQVHRDCLPVTDESTLEARVDLFGSPQFEGPQRSFAADDGLKRSIPSKSPEIAKDDLLLVRHPNIGTRRIPTTPFFDSTRPGLEPGA